MLNQFTDYALRLNLKGGGSVTVAAGQTSSTSLQISSKIILTGAEYFRTGNDNDTVSFIIKLNGQAIATLADDIFMGEKSGRYEFYQAILSSGHEIEIVYKNNGSQEARFRYNIISHVEKV